MLPLVRGQRPGLVPDPVRDRDAAEVVEQSRPPGRGDSRLVDPARRSRRGGQVGHSGGVACKDRCDHVGEARHRRDRALEGIRLEHERW